MPQVQANKEYNTFVRGLITEASPLTFPENASQDEDNYELNRKGYRSRRLGIDYETSYTLRSSGKASAEFIDDAVSIFKWEDVNTDGNLVILVVQIGLDLWFYDATKSTVSDNILNGGFAVELEGDNNYVFSFASISGDLVVATGADHVFRLQYDADADNISLFRHGLLVRDIWGVEDAYSPEYRLPTSDSNRNGRLYNLSNNGWSEPVPGSNLEIASYGTIGGAFSGEYQSDTGVTKYPNLYDKPQLGYRDDTSTYSPEFVLSDKSRSDLAPKGHLIIDLINRGSSRPYSASKLNILNNYRATGNQWNTADGDGIKNLGVHSIAAANPEYTPNRSYLNITLVNSSWDLPTDRSEDGVRVVASYGGRIWYAGFSSSVTDGDNRSPNLSTYIVYSQTVDSPDKIGKCFQEVSPTSAEDSALVDTDGGTIKIPGMSRVLRLVPFGRSLLVFCTNGVWEIRGGENGFSATDQIVERISDVGATSADSIIYAEDRVMYWADQGIYEIAREDLTANFVSKNVTEGTIQSFYNEIPSTGKRTVRGVYSGPNRRVIWIYNDLDTYDGISDLYVYNRQLNLDLVLGSFYTYTYATDATDAEYPRISAIYDSPNFVSQTYEEPVAVGTDIVVIGVDDIVVGRNAATASLVRTSYLTVKPSAAGDYDYTFASLRNPDFLDWESDASTSQDSPAYIETGIELLGDSQRRKQLEYLTVHMERTEDGFDVNLDPTSESSCLMRTKWDFASSSNSTKWGQQQQVYRLRRDYMPSGSGDTFEYDQSVISTKNRVRGRGRALSIRFDTEAGKACTIYGWGAKFYGNQDT